MRKAHEVKWRKEVEPFRVAGDPAWGPTGAWQFGELRVIASDGEGWDHAWRFTGAIWPIQCGRMTCMHERAVRLFKTSERIIMPTETTEQATCELCGEPMPPGETMFKFHGYSGPCPKPPLPRPRDLSLSDFHRVNLQRAMRWHKGGLEEWSVNDWLAAFGGEAGEALNAGKKHRRILSGLQQHGNVPTSEREAATKIMEELADTVIYADLVASRLGMSLSEAIIQKFNSISEREGFPERL